MWAEGGSIWSSWGAHQHLHHPPLLAQEGQSPQQIHSSFPIGIPGAAPHPCLGSSTSCPIPHSSTHMPSEGWTQGSPALQLGSAPSEHTNDIKTVRGSLAQLVLWLSHTLSGSWGVEQPAVQSHGTPQYTTSMNTEISEGNPRQLSQNPQEVELRQGKPLFYYRELWMSAKLVEQRAALVATGSPESSSSDTQVPAGNLSYSTACQCPPNPLLRKEGSHRHLVSTQSEGPSSGRAFPLPLCAPPHSETCLKCSTSRGCPGQGWLHAHCSEVRRVRGL